MRRRARMPVVLQPADSGFNSHLREGRRGGRAGEGAVPFVRLLWDKEVATLGMPHLKSLDLELQVRLFFLFFSLFVARCSLFPPPFFSPLPAANAIVSIAPPACFSFCTYVCGFSVVGFREPLTSSPSLRGLGDHRSRLLLRKRSNVRTVCSCWHRAQGYKLRLARSTAVPRSSGSGRAACTLALCSSFPLSRIFCRVPVSVVNSCPVRCFFLGTLFRSSSCLHPSSLFRLPSLQASSSSPSRPCAHLLSRHGATSSHLVSHASQNPPNTSPIIPRLFPSKHFYHKNVLPPRRTRHCCCYTYHVDILQAEMADVVSPIYLQCEWDTCVCVCVLFFASLSLQPQARLTSKR